LEGKIHPNLEIPLGLETKKVGLSNKLSWAQFGILEVPQNQLQSGATHRESGTTHKGFFAYFSLFSSEIFPVLTSFAF